MLNLFWKSVFFRFVISEVAPGADEMVDFNNRVNDLLKVNVVTYDLTLKTGLKLKKTSRFDETFLVKNY